MEDNKLIAEFMGVHQGEHTHFMVEPFALESYADVDDLKYDISWDWLMPVVEKIFGLAVADENIELFYDVQTHIPDKTATYNAVVEFIKEVNELTK